MGAKSTLQTKTETTYGVNLSCFFPKLTNEIVAVHKTPILQISPGYLM